MTKTQAKILIEDLEHKRQYCSNYDTVCDGCRETCECPETGLVVDKKLYDPKEYAGMNHEPGKCKGTYNIQQYLRGGGKLWLCSCCTLFGDARL